MCGYFFYFSNKNITGVDAKKYMPINAKGLVTVTNKTIERDFAQGIFRMRQLLDGQRIDVYMSDNSYNISIHTMQGGSPVDKTDVENIRQKFIRLLQVNQTNIENQKKKVLYKQNIFALSKLDDDINIQYDKIKNFKTILYNNILTTNKYLNIEEINIATSRTISNPQFNDIIDNIKREYDAMSIATNTTQVNLSIQQQQNFSLNVEQEIETSIKHSILQNLNQYLDFKSDRNIKSINIDGVIILDDDFKVTNDSICILYDNKIDNLYALYKIDTRQLFLVEKKYFYRIFNLTSRENIRNFILFDYYSNLTFGNEIDEELKLNIFITIKYFINKLPSNIRNNYFTIQEIQHILEQKYENIFRITFDFKVRRHVWAKKYLKYKQKYLNLKYQLKKIKFTDESPNNTLLGDEKLTVLAAS